jgi:hypothetical protein
MLGIKCKCYHNTGTWTTPVWAEVKNISDFQVEPKWAFGEAKIRATRVSMVAPTNLTCGITGKMLKDPADSEFTAWNTAFHTAAPLDLLILDGPKDTVGAEGVRGYFYLEGWTESQGTGDIVYKDFGLSPGLPTDGNYLKFATVATGGTLTLTDPG